ncbi:MAG: nucleotide exchange factor GrpE [Bacteroidetes bacterium]|nr:nucleotide exchange factor GrpE [Bacteroidota bacterium]MBP7256152.1 nucleotide exchange factor GrpE [Chitinophagales bacterium]MBK7139516.1 nucleotide exchange factor GrpE [Bacteroidota bacterium]MBK7641388.1 nucleotide exchange factor GrpE [Bacteroidota bacterium]MBK8673469.1 nucleotide exchange factor GrpE [Bacteroidota bacterium]
MVNEELTSDDEILENALNADTASVISDDEKQEQDDNLANPVESEVEKLKAELGEAKDKYLRIFAEFDNSKRRNAKERLELIKTAGLEILQDLLPVLDDLGRAEKIIETATDLENVKKGFDLIKEKLVRTLQNKGLKAMESIGADFDADFHEAITEIPAPNPEMVGKVVDEVEKGYILNEKIIRYAKVIVGK